MKAAAAMRFPRRKSAKHTVPESLTLCRDRASASSSRRCRTVTGGAYRFRMQAAFPFVLFTDEGFFYLQIKTERIQVIYHVQKGIDKSRSH